MKRILKLLIKTALVLLLLPLMLVFAIFLYATFVNPSAEKTMQEMTEFLEQRKSPGNGFGGEAGLQISDSRYASEKFFWMDSSHLIFRVKATVKAPEDGGKVFIWDVSADTIKPLDSNYAISGFRDNKLYFVRRNEDRSTRAQAPRYDYFSAEIRELEDRWVVESEENYTDKLQLPSEQYELSWVGESFPSFRVKREFREELGVPIHRFKYMWEWGWILRMPKLGEKYWGQSVPEMGFIDLDGKLYADQPGRKVADIIDLPAREFLGLRLVYVAYLDRYWLANTVYGDLSKTRIMGFVDRDGDFSPYLWPDGWLQYFAIPLPTRKGVFWSGIDYRKNKSGSSLKGAFIRGYNGRIHKVIEGAAVAMRMSADGCKVAFFNSLSEEDRSKTSLKIFNACSSIIGNRVIENVKY